MIDYISDGRLWDMKIMTQITHKRIRYFEISHVIILDKYPVPNSWIDLHPRYYSKYFQMYNFHLLLKDEM